MGALKTIRSDARRNLSLRKALDRAREALTRRDLVQARKAILKAGEQGPLAVRPTRLLWEVVSRWLRAVKSGEGGPLDRLFNAPEVDPHLDEGDAARGRGEHEAALEHFRAALTISPLSPEAIYDIGLTHKDLRDLTEASHWLKLVPDILGAERRRGPVTRQLVADSFVNLARIELTSGHRARAAAFALKALDVKADFEPARSFLWDLERLVGAK